MINPRRLSSLLLVVVAALASMATDCEQDRAGWSRPSSPGSRSVWKAIRRLPPRTRRLSRFAWPAWTTENNVKPSWRSYAATTLTEMAPNVFEAEFFDVPIDIVHTITVQDRNQCRREPRGNGRVTTGVTINGTRLERVLPDTNALQFAVDEDGTVQSPRT